MIDVELVYYGRHEFERGGRDWWPHMDPRLLVMLDVFRHQWGKPVAISGHPDALGRELPATVKSDHNLIAHGAVLAADVLPAGIETREDARHAVAIAHRIGFTAVGFYPQWRPRPGLHLGVRREKRPGQPALWGAVLSDGKQTYTTLEAALERLA